MREYTGSEPQSYEYFHTRVKYSFGEVFFSYRDEDGKRLDIVVIFDPKYPNSNITNSKIPRGITLVLESRLKFELKYFEEIDKNLKDLLKQVEEFNIDQSSILNHIKQGLNSKGYNFYKGEFEDDGYSLDWM